MGVIFALDKNETMSSNLDLITSNDQLTRSERGTVASKIDLLGVIGFAAACEINYEYARQLSSKSTKVKLGYATLVKIRKYLYS